MVEFGNKHPNITVAPAPERKKRPKPSGAPGFGGEPATAPELSETPVVDEVQATAPVEPEQPIVHLPPVSDEMPSDEPVEPQTAAEAHKNLASIGGVESAPPPEEP